MISRKNRFSGRGSLNHVYRKGRGVRGQLVSLKFIASKRDDYRLAVVVSKKVSKSAVRRNRIRRRLYESVRRMRKDSGQPWQYDLVLTVFHEDVATMPAQEVESAVQDLLVKAKVRL